MVCEYRTLPIIRMNCGRRKKRLKNLDNTFFLHHVYNTSCLDENSGCIRDEGVSNKDRVEKVKEEKSEKSLNSRKSSVQHVNIFRKNVLVSSAANVVKASIYSFSTMFMIPVLIVILLKQSETIEAFNLDMDTRVVFSQPPSTMFGFSVAGHKEGNVGW